MSRRLAWVMLASQIVPLLLVASCTLSPAFAADVPDSLMVVRVEQPAQCQTQAMPKPLPCAFILAMMERMKARCDHCNGGQTCAMRP